MRKGAPEPHGWTETESARLTIVTGNSPRLTRKRRHPLLRLLIIGVAAAGATASLITIGTYLS